MIITCSTCEASFDDEFRWTFCPHETFSANNGRNEFRHHSESHLKIKQLPEYKSSIRPQEWEATGVRHIWRNMTTQKFHFVDETENFVDTPYDTIDDALLALNEYAKCI